MNWKELDITPAIALTAEPRYGSSQQAELTRQNGSHSGDKLRLAASCCNNLKSS